MMPPPSLENNAGVAIDKTPNMMRKNQAASTHEPKKISGLTSESSQLLSLKK